MVYWRVNTVPVFAEIAEYRLHYDTLVCSLSLVDITHRIVAHNLLHCLHNDCWPNCIGRPRLAERFVLLDSVACRGGAHGATAPGIHPGGHPRGQFSLKKCR